MDVRRGAVGAWEMMIAPSSIVYVVSMDSVCGEADIRFERSREGLFSIRPDRSLYG